MSTTGPRWIVVAGSIVWALGALALGLALVQAAGSFNDNAAFWLPYPYPRPGSEGLMLYETLLMRRGEALYGPITPDRFISGPYPPLYYLLAGWLLPANTAGFTEGRTLSLWAAFGVAAALVLLVGVGGWGLGVGKVRGSGIRDQGSEAIKDQPPHSSFLIPHSSFPIPSPQPLIPIVAGLLGAGLWLIQPPTLIWATRFRADMLMLAFTALGLLAVAAGTARRDPARPLHWLTWAAIPLFALAIFTKQTALWGPLAAGLFLLVRQPRRAIIWGLVLALTVGIPFALLDLATDHGFYLKMVVYHRLPYSLPTLRRLVEAFVEDHGFLFLVAAGYAAWRLLTRRLDLATCALIAGVAVLPTAGVVGADSNHLLFLGFACAWCAGAALVGVGGWGLGVGVSRGSGIRDQGSGTSKNEPSHSASRIPHSVTLTPNPQPLTPVLKSKIQNPKSKIPNPQPLIPIVAIAAFLLLLGYVAQVRDPAGWYGADLHRPSAAEQEQIRKIIANVRENPGENFFADDPGVLALAGKDTAYDDPFTMTALALDGGWDESTFVAQLRTGHFPLIILAGDAFDPTHPLRSDILTPAMLDALKSGYTLLFRDVYYTYAPRQGP